MKKTYTLITLLLALFLVACNNTPLPEDLDFSMKFDLTYKLDDGSDYKVYKVKLGETLPVPNEPTKEGYNFDGWYVGDEKFEGTVVEASALTLVARFSPKQGTIVSYNVSFYDDDILLQTISVTHGDNVETTPDTNKEGKNFIGWFVDVDLTIQFSLENKIIEDTILFGKWSTIEYDVIFYRGSNIFDAVTVNGGVTIPNINTDVTGYQFVGWYTNSMLTQPYDSSIPVTSNLTLYGKWSTLTYVVTYFDGNTSIATKNVEYGNSAPTNIDTTKNGYTFVGWYTNSLLTTAYNGESIIANTSLYGKWQQNSDPNPGSYTGYYSSLNGLNGAQLKTALITLTKKGSNTGSTNQVKQADVVSGNTYYNIYTGNGSYGNREHVVPESKLKSYGGPADDLHNLRSAVVSVNSSRSNYPFADYAGGGGYRLISKTWFPGDEHKGDVARIILYITTRYNIDMTKSSVQIDLGNLEMFLRWHIQDPVNNFERTRNNRIQNIQNNRNPFIDHPELAWVLYSRPSNLSTQTFDYIPISTFTSNFYTA